MYVINYIIAIIDLKSLYPWRPQHRNQWESCTHTTPPSIFRWRWEPHNCMSLFSLSTIMYRHPIRGGSLIRLVVIGHNIYLITADLEFDRREGTELNFETKTKFTTRPRMRTGYNMHASYMILHAHVNASSKKEALGTYIWQYHVASYEKRDHHLWFVCSMYLVPKQ